VICGIKAYGRRAEDTLTRDLPTWPVTVRQAGAAVCLVCTPGIVSAREAGPSSLPGAGGRPAGRLKRPRGPGAGIPSLVRIFLIGTLPTSR